MDPDPDPAPDPDSTPDPTPDPNFFSYFLITYPQAHYLQSLKNNFLLIFVLKVYLQALL
jgi:hypothetical protein